MPNGRRTTDATGLRFPLQLVIFIASTCVTVAVTIWSSQAGMQARLGNIQTQMEWAAKLQAAENKAQEDRATAIREAVQDMKRRQELQQYEIQGLKEAILKQGAPRR